MMPERYLRSGPAARETLAQLIEMRTVLGITRIADLTGLDILGIPVVQAVRPFSCSNAVAQGKGSSLTIAGISAILECAETCFAERVDRYNVVVASANALEIQDGWFEAYLQTGACSRWRSCDTTWVAGRDLLSGTVKMIPFELVHTNFLFPQPSHEGLFASSTTGLAAALIEDDAITHAIFECVERDALARARNIHGFFHRFRIDPSTITDPTVCELLDLLESKGMLVGLWQAPSVANLPVVWCHLMERDASNALIPLPADGSAASFNPAAAIIHAIYEAAQTRLTAISGSRDDITRASYPKYPNFDQLNAHRRLLSEGPRLCSFQNLGEGHLVTRDCDLLPILEEQGISNVLLVRIDTKPLSDLSVVKVVIPQLQPLLEH